MRYLAVLFFVLSALGLRSQAVSVECLPAGEYNTSDDYFSLPATRYPKATRAGILFIEGSDSTFLQFPLEVDFDSTTLYIVDETNVFKSAHIDSVAAYSTTDDMAVFIRGCQEDNYAKEFVAMQPDTNEIVWSHGDEIYKGTYRLLVDGVLVTGSGGSGSQKIDTFQLSGDSILLSLENDFEAAKILDLSGILVGKVDTFELNGNILSISMENDGVPSNDVDLSNLATSTNSETQTVANDSMLVVMSLPADNNNIDVFAGPLRMIYRDPPIQPIHYKRSGQYIIFYENKDSEKIIVNIIN